MLRCSDTTDRDQTARSCPLRGLRHSRLALIFVLTVPTAVAISCIRFLPHGYDGLLCGRKTQPKEGAANTFPVHSVWYEHSASSRNATTIAIVQARV